MAARRGASTIVMIDRHLSTPVASVLLIGFLVMFCVIGVVGREKIVATLPDLAGIYELIGLKVNLRGLDFSEVTAHREMDGSTPVLVSTIGVGITFTMLMHPTIGLFNDVIAMFGLKGPAWLTDPRFALLSVAFVDVWKGVGLATVIYIAGIVSIPAEYYEAAKMDGANALQRFWNVTLPLDRPATVTVISLSLIGGLRSIDLIQVSRIPLTFHPSQEKESC